MTNYKRPATEVVCEWCNTPFMKENRFITETVKRNGVHCCSRKCSNNYINNKTRERSNPFNHYMISIRKRKLSITDTDTPVTAEYLEIIWNEQNGLCAITNIPMVHAKQRSKKLLEQASVDRLDNSKGYIEGNIQFTTLGANYLRNTFSLEEVEEFIAKI